jgi:hypothetical protein
MKELPDNVREALEEAVNLYIEEISRDARLAMSDMIYNQIEKVFIEKTSKIKELFVDAIKMPGSGE